MWEKEEKLASTFWLLLLLKSLQSYPTLRPQRWQPTRLLHPWIVQARVLEWVAIAFSTTFWLLKDNFSTPSSKDKFISAQFSKARNRNSPAKLLEFRDGRYFHRHSNDL